MLAPVLEVDTPGSEASIFDTRALQQLDSAHYLHPFTDHGALRDRGARVMVRGDGIYLWDSEGHKVIDGMSGLWCVNVGYGRASMTQAVARQMDTLPITASSTRPTCRR
jgi:putrescine aminotransferase